MDAQTSNAVAHFVLLCADGRQRHLLGENIEGLRCAAYVDLKRLAANYNFCKRKCNKIIAVVKADAYGHGAVEISKTLIEEGCDSFAVSNIDEGIELRRNAVGGEIIMLGYVPQSRYGQLADYLISPLVYDDISYGAARKTKLPCYLKIDSGMRRLGFYPKDERVDKIVKDRSLDIRGVFTHLSVADSFTQDDTQFTERQIADFLGVAELVKHERPDAALYCCNSAAAVRYPFLFDGARIGISLYGIKPSIEVGDLDILPIMSFKSVVSSVKTANTDDDISYGRTCRLKEERKIAVVSVGYADGFRRALSNCGQVVINGRRAPVLGIVTMDQTVVDVSNIDCRVGDEAVLFGDSLSVWEVAEKANTIPYEILCGISKRVPRIYTKGVIL